MSSSCKKKIGLSPENAARRLEFAQNYLNFDWSNTIFCDEKSSKTSQISGSFYIDQPLHALIRKTWFSIKKAVASIPIIGDA